MASKGARQHRRAKREMEEGPERSIIFTYDYHERYMDVLTCGHIHSNSYLNGHKRRCHLCKGKTSWIAPVMESLVRLWIKIAY